MKKIISESELITRIQEKGYKKGVKYLLPHIIVNKESKSRYRYFKFSESMFILFTKTRKVHNLIEDRMCLFKNISEKQQKKLFNDLMTFSPCEIKDNSLF